MFTVQNKRCILIANTIFLSSCILFKCFKIHNSSIFLLGWPSERSNLTYHERSKYMYSLNNILHRTFYINSLFFSCLPYFSQCSRSFVIMFLKILGFFDVLFRCLFKYFLVQLKFCYLFGNYPQCVSGCQFCISIIQVCIALICLPHHHQKRYFIASQNVFFLWKKASTVSASLVVCC